MTNIDLLRLEMATLWEQDAYGRFRQHPLVALGVADDGVAPRFDPALAHDLLQALEQVPVENGATEAAIERYRKVLDDQAVELRSGPSYVFPPHVQAGPAAGLDLVTFGNGASPELRRARPEAWWEQDEWDDLLSGRLGPWAMAMLGKRVAAICHTPVASPVAAEAGVWTHPECRGRGYAAIVTGAWAEIARRKYETLFYSTNAENLASQANARKLGLKPIGWIWQIEAKGQAAAQA